MTLTAMYSLTAHRRSDRNRRVARTSSELDMYPKLTQLDVAILLFHGWSIHGAGLYEPDHAPRGTLFAIYPPRGLLRLVPPRSYRKKTQF